MQQKETEETKRRRVEGRWVWSGIRCACKCHVDGRSEEKGDLLNIALSLIETARWQPPSRR